jgi:RNA recognition motif-containing protein
VKLLRMEDGKSRGIAFVKFSTESARTKALDLNGTEQYGRPIKVEKSNGKADNPNKRNDGGKGNFGNTNDKPIPDVIDSSVIAVISRTLAVLQTKNLERYLIKII